MTVRWLVATNLLVAGLLAGSLAGLTGCGSSSTPGSPQTGLGAALDAVSGTGPSAQYVEYGDHAALRRLGVLHPSKLSNAPGPADDLRWDLVVEVGSGQLGQLAPALDKAVGLNPLAADTAITVGQPPNAGTTLVGHFDASAITAELAAKGAKPHTFGSTRGLAFGADNAIDPNSPLSAALGGLNPLNDAVVTSTRITAARNAATLERTDGGTPSLLHTGRFADVAGCLGDVLAAVVLKPAHDRNAALIGVGVRTPTKAASTQHEILCVVPASGRSAAVAAALRTQLAPTALDPLTNSRRSDQLESTTFDRGAGLPRAVLTLRPDTRPGYLFQQVGRDGLSIIDGGCAAARLARHAC